ncbi:MAG: 50S ribosomal protein L5 [Candidatus Pacebacteria bacterium]|nr:50S ribosomal protein L5 [Candidatus Paceibacterota bacterium]
MKTQSHTIKDKEKALFDEMKGDFGFKNKMEAPQLVKVVIGSATGSVKDANKKKLIGDRLTKITGQKVAEKAAKKSIATFKVREGDPVGYQVTLRGDRMYSFLDKLVNIALPRTRDFRGLKPEAIDAMGNFTIGVKEHTVFPETSDEELKDVFGFAVTIVTTSKDKKLTRAMLEKLGFLFKK